MRVAARSTSEPQIDSPRIQRLERSKLLRHYERRVVWQHHSAAAHPNLPGRRGHMTNEHRRRRTSKSGNRVMFRQPIALVSQPLRVLRQVDRSGNCAARGLARSHAHKIEYRNG